MRKVIQSVLLTADGICDGDFIPKVREFQDDAYMRDGLAQALACDAMILGKNTYEVFKNVFPKRSDPWAERVNSIPKYVFSRSLDKVEWQNCSLVRGDAFAEVKRLKDGSGGDLLTYGHGALSEALATSGLIDIVDLAIFPLTAGKGKAFSRESLRYVMKLGATKIYSKGIVKLTYEPQYAA